MFLILSAILFLLIGLALGIGVLAGYSDVRSLSIPNWMSASIGGLFCLAYALAWIGGIHLNVFFPILSHLCAMFLMFLVTYGMFAARMLGAGDSKLATMFALWTGLQGLPAFLFFMTLTGGLLGVASLYMRKHALVSSPSEGGWAYAIQNGQNAVPYGIAIAAGAFAAFGASGYLSVSKFLELAGG